jgi:hypothetical protein
MRLRRALAFSVPCLLACGTDPEDFGRCTGGLTLSVSAEVRPQFAWGPSDCPVHEVVVEEASLILWLLSSPSPANSIESPVRYGQARPPLLGDSGATLTPGTRYLVRLYRIDDDGLVAAAGEQLFQYQPEP